MLQHQEEYAVWTKGEWHRIGNTFRSCAGHRVPWGSELDHVVTAFRLVGRLFGKSLRQEWCVYSSPCRQVMNCLRSSMPLYRSVVSFLPVSQIKRSFIESIHVCSSEVVHVGNGDTSEYGTFLCMCQRISFRYDYICAQMTGRSWADSAVARMNNQHKICVPCLLCVCLLRV